MFYIKSVIKNFFNIFGLDIKKIKYISGENPTFREALGYEFENEAMNTINLIKKNTMLPKKRLVTLYQQVVYCEKNKIEGCFVECGVWKGGAIGLMAHANLLWSDSRRELHLFDAFQEICEPELTIDGPRAMKEVQNFIGADGLISGRLHPLIGIYDGIGGPGTLDHNRTLLQDVLNYPKNYINYHVGWFQNTLPQCEKEIQSIAILRLDGDWYASTKICLDYLYDKVVSGGIVIIDDYGAYDGCKRAVDEFLANRGISAYLSSVDSDCRYFVKS